MCRFAEVRRNTATWPPQLSAISAGMRQKQSAETMFASLDRRAVLRGLAAAAAVAPAATTALAQIAPQPIAATARVTTGAEVAAASGFQAFAGRRIGLITNPTGRIGGEHLVDALIRTRGVTLAAILSPEHGFRGNAEAGASVRSGRDVKTGIPVFSLYGATKKPTPAMLRGLDVLVFDIQDVGVRSYTYISTMGLAMQAAAAARIPFVVLDRPNPIGGVDVAGFVLEPALKSFVGQYPIPIVHGMSVGELAAMIKGERWLAGLERLNLTVIRCAGWTRTMRWPQTQLPWVATSPNIPSFDCALTYPGIGMVGDTLVNEGRGTPAPFTQFGAPWLDASAAAASLNASRLPGVRFEATSYTPQSIPNVAANPRFEGQRIGAIRIAVTDIAAYKPVEVGVHALAVLQAQARARNASLFGGLGMFHAISGTKRLHQMLERGATGPDITAAWQGEVARFKTQRQKYLVY